MNGYKVIVDKSTVPVGTSEKVREVIRRETTHPFSVVSNPEFLKQGAAVDDFLKPDRVVIGAEDEKAGEIMRQLYQPFTRTGAPIMVMDCASAEICKYAANALLATRISFMNEVPPCANCSARTWTRCAARWGRPAHRPAVPVSGMRVRRQLFPKDVRPSSSSPPTSNMISGFSSRRGGQRGAEDPAGSTDREPFRLAEGKTIAVWGLSFKPRTDDMREAPSIVIINRLLSAGARIQAFDPAAMDVARRSSAAGSPWRPRATMRWPEPMRWP